MCSISIPKNYRMITLILEPLIITLIKEINLQITNKT